MHPTGPSPGRARKRHLAHLVLGLVLFCLPGANAARAAEAATPVELIAQLYVAHAAAFAGKAPPLHTGGPAALAYFSPDLAARMKAKQLDFDPIYAGQDAKITALRIVAHPQTPTEGDRSLVVVNFRNFGEPVRLTYYVKRMPGGEWRIVDIAARDWRLTNIVGAS